MKIRVDFTNADPYSGNDYAAYDESTYGGDPSDKMGHGRTEDEALQELAAQMASDEDETSLDLVAEELAANERGDLVTQKFIGYLREVFA